MRPLITYPDGLKPGSTFSYFRDMLKNSYDLCTFMDFLDEYSKFVNIYLDSMLNQQTDPHYFGGSWVSFHRDYNILSNSIHNKISDFETNWSFQNVEFQNRNQNIESDEWKILNNSQKITLMRALKTYTSFLIDKKFLKLFSKFNTGDYWSLANKVILSDNLYNNVFFKLELLHLIDDSDIENLEKIILEWGTIRETFNDEIPILISGALSYNRILSFYYLIRAFKGEKINRNINKSIECIENDIQFFTGKYNNKNRSLKPFLKLGSYSYVDLMNYLNKLPFKLNNDLYIFVGQKGLFKRNVKYAVHFNLGAFFLHDANYDKIEHCLLHPLEYHLENYNKFDNTSDLLRELADSPNIKYKRDTIGRLKFIKIHGFPDSPKDNKKINDILKETIDRELESSEDLVRQIIISLIMAKFLSDPNINNAVLLTIIFRINKMFANKDN